MKILHDRTNIRRLIAHVYPFYDRATSITVDKSKSFGEDNWNLATVNWPAIGAVCLDEATQFAVAIIRAVQIAEEFDREV